MFSFIFTLFILNLLKVINCKLVSIDLTENSRLIGQNSEFLQKDLNVFLGVPYAKAPVGGLRFRKPVPIDNYAEVVNATVMPPPCLHYNNGRIDVPNEMPWSSERTGDEDCLYLNVWSPNMTGDINNKLYPVMVWIYGGGFQTGSIDLDIYDGRALAAVGNVVVVTLNYRTGVLGLFYSGTDDAPGNVALHDQRLALEWVHNNIAKFGGDPESVTIFGESAGSISIGIHLLSPLLGPVFQKAILQSGSPYHNIGGVSPELALKQSQLIARDANCLTPDGVIQFECMRKLSTNEIRLIYKDIYSRDIALQLIYGEEISPKHPIHTIEEKEIEPTQVLIGTNKDEGSSVLFMGIPEVFSRKGPLNMTKAYAKQFISAVSQGWWLGVLSDEHLQQISDFYMNNISEDDYVLVRQSLVDLIGDSLFICPSVYLAESLSQIRGTEVFYYHFTHIKQFDNHWGDWMGSPHFEEVQYVFGLPLRYPSSYAEEEVQLSRNLIQSWSSFARNGKPGNYFGDNGWPAYDPIERKYIEINGLKRNLYLRNGPRLEECQFWKQFFDQQCITKHEEL